MSAMGFVRPPVAAGRRANEAADSYLGLFHAQSPAAALPGPSTKSHCGLGEMEKSGEEFLPRRS